MMTKIRHRLNQKGFTLVELMVVIAILGILAAIAIPKFSDSTSAANTAKIAADLRTIDSALVMYQANGGVVADGTGGTTATTVAALVSAGYLVSAPTTPAGTYYLNGTKQTTALTKGTSYSIDAANVRAYLSNSANTSDKFYK